MEGVRRRLSPGTGNHKYTRKESGGKGEGGAL